MISIIFIVAQIAFLGVFILTHTLLGIKRGAKKTRWYFLMSTILVTILFMIIGFIPIYSFISEDMARSIAVRVFGDSDPIVEQLFSVGGHEIITIVFDFVIKNILFIFTYFILRWVLMMLIANRIWKKIDNENNYPEDPKERLIGGFIGGFRGLLAGMVALLPILVLANSLENDKLISKKSYFPETVQKVIEANQYNFIKPFNIIKINDTGLVDRFYDLAFSTRIKGNRVRWSAEAAFISEAAIQAYDINKSGEKITLTVDKIKEYEGLIKKMSKSRLINLALKPGVNYGIKETPSLNISDDKKEIIEKRLDTLNVRLDKDIKEIYILFLEMIELKSIEEWNEIFNSPQMILELDKKEQDKVFGLLRRLFSLNSLELADFGLELMLYTDYSEKIISWSASSSDRNKLITAVIKKLNTFKGKFVATAGNDAIDAVTKIVLEFPKNIYIDDKKIDIKTLFDGGINPLLIDNNEYKIWLKNSLEIMTGFKSLEAFVEPGVDYMAANIAKNIEKIDSQQLNTFRTKVIDELNISENLTKELIWLSDTYEKLIELYKFKKSESSDIVILLDEILPSKEGRDAFDSLINTALKGKTLSTFTSSLSGAIMKKYITEPVGVMKSVSRAADLDTFDLSSEIFILKDLLYNLYQIENFSLQEIAKDENSYNKLIPYMLDYLRSDKKDKILDSNIIYSIIDESLSHNEHLKIPNFVKDKSGTHINWIAKEEIILLLDTINFMEIDIEKLLKNEYAQDELKKQIIKLSKDEKNITEILKSGILYGQISSMLIDNENVAVPPDAIVKDRTNKYYDAIKKEEIEKLFKILNMLNIENIDNVSTSLKISKFTNEKIKEMIEVDSSFISYEITNGIKKLDGLIIPEKAYTSSTKSQITKYELNKMVELFNNLGIEMSKLDKDTNIENIINELLISKFTQIAYKDSLMVRSFITSGISKITTITSENAYDENGILSTQEISEIFKVLNKLDKGNEKISSLKEKINLDTLTLARAKELIEMSNSVLICAIVSDKILGADQINTLELPREIFTSDSKKILVKKELYALIDSLVVLSHSETTILKDFMDTFNMSKVTIQEMKDVLNANSEIIRYLISNEFTSGKNSIVIKTQDSNAISRNDLYDLLDVIGIEFGANQKLVDINKVYDDITLKKLREMVNSKSVLIKQIATGQISKHLGKSERLEQEYVTSEVLDSTGRYINSYEFDKILNALLVVSNHDETKKMSEIIDTLDNLTLNEAYEIININSTVLNRKISDTIIDKLGQETIHTQTLDNKQYIKLSELSEALRLLENTLGNIHINTLNDKLSDMMVTEASALVYTDNLLIYGINSSYVEKHIKDQIRKDSYDTSYIGKDQYLQRIIKQSELRSLMDVVIQISGNVRLSKIMDTFEPETLKIRKFDYIPIGRSPIVKSMVSYALLEAIDQDKYPIDKRAYDDYDGSGSHELSYAEITNFINVLKQIDQGNDSTLLDIVDTIKNNQITLNTLRVVVSSDSYIMRILLTKGITQTFPKLGNVDIYESTSKTVSGNDFKLIKKDELIKFINAIGHFTSLNGTFDSAMQYKFEQASSSDIKKALDERSIIFHRVITILLEDFNLITTYSYENQYLVREDEILNLLDTLSALQLNSISDMSNMNGLSLIIKLLQFKMTDRYGSKFSKYIDKDKPENEGLTIVKSYLIKTINDPNITNRLELYNRYMSL